MFSQSSKTDGGVNKKQSASETHQISDEAVGMKKQRNETPKLLISLSHKSSKCWAHFKVYNPVAEGYKKGIAVCIHCSQEIKYENGLAGLRGHIRVKHKDEMIVADSLEAKTSSANKQALIQGLNAYENPNKKSKKERYMEAAVAWVVDEAVPFNSVEKKSFRRMILTLDSSAPVLTAINIRDEVDFKGSICKKAVERELKGHFFSLTTDHWTSVNGQTYSCLTAHYIVKGKFKKCLLDFEVFKGSTQGASMGKD